MGRRQPQHQLGNQSCTTWAQSLVGKSKVSVDENTAHNNPTLPRFLCSMCNICYDPVSFKSPL